VSAPRKKAERLPKIKVTKAAQKALAALLMLVIRKLHSDTSSEIGGWV
jgi:hypothetical protein